MPTSNFQRESEEISGSIEFKIPLIIAWENSPGKNIYLANFSESSLEIFLVSKASQYYNL